MTNYSEIKEKILDIAFEIIETAVGADETQIQQSEYLIDADLWTKLHLAFAELMLLEEPDLDSDDSTDTGLE
jgi:hypothetical protein